MTSGQISIGIIAFSWMAGFLSYYWVSDHPRAEKKKALEELASQSMNFIFFIWIGKAALNFPRFIEDPFVMLSYPSDSNAFYFASFLSAILVAWKSRRGQIHALSLLDALIPVFLIASFTYEFIHIVFRDQTHAVGYFVLLAALILLFLWMRGRAGAVVSIVVLSVGWGVGVLGLSLATPFMIVFGYTMQPSFVGLFLLFCFVLYRLDKKKEGVVSERY